MYTIKKYLEEPIVEFSVDEEFRVYDHLPSSIEEANQLLDTLEEPVYYVVDATNLQLDFGSAVAALAMLVKGELALFKHSRIHKIIVVGTGALLELSAKALGQEQYGGLTVYFFPTIDEALEAIRTEVNGEGKMVSTL